MSHDEEEGRPESLYGSEGSKEICSKAALSMSHDEEEGRPDSLYDAEEMAFAKSLYRFDFMVFPFFVLWYFCVSALFVWPAVGSVKAPVPPPWVLFLQAMLAVGSSMVMHTEIHMPAPKKADDMYHALRYIGSWITLTRHCLAFQMVHSIFSFLGAAAGISWLVHATNGMTLFVGSAGLFVTVQYFVLVHYNPEFMSRCERVAKSDPPMPMRSLNILIHTPALIIAVLDITLSKNRVVLGSHGSRLASFILCIFYCVGYVVLVLANRRATGYYPYAILKEITSIRQWLTFTVTQGLTFCAFCSIACGLAVLVPQVW
jgi:hypothetical protein